MRRFPFAGILVARSVSRIGSLMTFIAIPWFVLVTTGSATKAGVVAAAEMAPFVLAGLFGGPWIDHWGARRVSIVTDLASGAAVAALPALYHADALSFPVFLALVAVAGTLRGLGDTAKSAIVPRAIAASGVETTRAATIQDGVHRLSGLLGLPMAGVLVGWIGAAEVLYVDAASFVVCALLVALFVRVDAAPAEPADREPYLRALRGGVTYLRGDRLVLALSLMVLATNLFDQAFAAVYTPVWAHDVLHDPYALGFVGGSFALGAVLGNLGYVALAPRLPRYLTFAVCFLVGGGTRFLSMAFGGGIWPVVIVGFAAGVAMSTVNPIMSAILYERVPEAMQARVFGLVGAVASAGIPLGSLLGGGLVSAVGLRWALIATGVLYGLVTVCPLVFPTWRGIDRAPAAAPEPELVASR
ncbi:MFS transporter [Longispora sp. NPDC051575]|uniref:MFS transporter n=1 Tax=Longispora sp. NPDC051575 TaxID=3154943 RepID=UPI0034145760